MLERNYTDAFLELLKKDEFSEGSVEKKIENEESPLRVLLTITFSFFIAGFGMVGAGILLDVVQNWPLYENINEILILVPPLLGLKGNLEMTLASRLSTQVNIGKIHDYKTTVSALVGNSVIIQLQSIIVGFLASFLAALFEFIYTRQFNPNHLLIVITSSVGTASLASLLLASLVMGIIIISHKKNVNPDNIATPIASSLGDVVTLAILSGFGTFLYINKQYIAIPITIIIIYIILIPVFIYISYKNEFVCETLKQGWVPIIMAMLISSAAGAILKTSNGEYPVVAIFQPVINGVGGNLVAILASRLSTSIHRTSTKGEYPTWAPRSFFKYPYETFFGKHNPESKITQMLTMLILPGHVVFFFTLFYIKKEEADLDLTASLVIFYLAIAFVQVLLLFLLCYWLVLLVWKFGMNPDNVCIPYLTAIGDFLGVVLLLFAIHMTFLSGNESVKYHTKAPSIVSNTTAIYNSTLLYEVVTNSF